MRIFREFSETKDAPTLEQEAMICNKHVQIRTTDTTSNFIENDTLSVIVLGDSLNR